MDKSAPDAKAIQKPFPLSSRVVIVGAGRFARNYLRSLTELYQNHGDCPDARPTLILTRTRISSAKALVAEFSHSREPYPLKLAAAQVCNRHQLQRLLLDCLPRLTCITARDPKSGDRIHATYSLLALDYGAVLCEKPFTVARDAEASQAAIDQLANHPQAGRFGLELPMAVVKEALLDHPFWGEKLRKAREIDFLWQMQRTSKDLVSDLALHPWSLIPASGEVRVERIKSGPARIEAWLHWPSLADSGVYGCGRMVLDCGGQFRGMRVDDHALQFRYAYDRLQVLEHRVSWEEAPHSKTAAGSARVALEVDNPLRRHIAAALQARPIIGCRQTIQSQRFAQSLCA